MKRYWLFMFAKYYPEGGLGDLYGCYDAVEDCFIELERYVLSLRKEEYCYILDIQTGELIIPEGWDYDERYSRFVDGSF